MNDSFPVEAQLSLYGDTMCRDTGQYFCNSRPFSSPRFGAKVTLLPSGKAAFREIHRAILAAKHFVWIADWQMSHDVELLRTKDPEHPNRLHNVIEEVIKSKPVHVRVILYWSVADGTPGTYDRQAKKKLESLNKKGYPGSVAVLLQNPTTDQGDEMDYSHHQKFVVVDGRVGFIGGIDLANGRWETPSYDVVVDPNRFVVNEMYNPCAKKARGATTQELKLIRDFGFAEPWKDVLLDEGCQPRMPWQDVHMKLEGPSVVDIHRNFVRRWNMAFVDLKYKGEFTNYIGKAWLNKIGAWSVLRDAQRDQPGSAVVQIVRSVSRKHLKSEIRFDEDLDLFPDVREQVLWKRALPAWKNEHQDNILNAVVNCIRSADNYIYIETQFFISGFGRWGDVDSGKIGNEDNGIQNKVVEELASRIGFHIKANTPFHVYLVIPTHPEGFPSSGAVWKQHWFALGAVKHGTRSLVRQIEEHLRQAHRSPSEWTKYITVLNMRNFGATVQFARDPSTNDEDFSCEIGRYVVTEQIYIHSKLLIVDDAVAIIGSANTNDRSLTGNGDTEIAAVIVDTEGVEFRDLGSPTFKVQTRKFARELREQLWRKHFGFQIDDTDYFNSGIRAQRAGKRLESELPHPPRQTTTKARFAKIAGIDIDVFLAKPCSADTVAAFQAIAAHNARVYERVFVHTPRNSFGKFADVESFYKLPYGLAVDQQSVNSRRLLHENPTGFDRIDESKKQEVMATRTVMYNHEIQPIIKNPELSGVIPPALQPSFMTKNLSPQQKERVKNLDFGRRVQLYDNGTVHDVNKAIKELGDELVGFIVATPLDWGTKVKIEGNPSKESIINVDLAMTPSNAERPDNGAAT